MTSKYSSSLHIYFGIYGCVNISTLKYSRMKYAIITAYLTIK